MFLRHLQNADELYLVNDAVQNISKEWKFEIRYGRWT